MTWFGLPLLLAVAVLGTAPSAPPETVKPGTFRFWKPSDGAAHWVSDGVRIDIAPAPCPPPPSACSPDSPKNVAEVIVTAPGLAPFRTRTDDHAFYHRIAVARFNKRDARPGVVIENDSGGSGGYVREQLIVARDNGFQVQWIPDQDTVLSGSLGEKLTDRTGDGKIDFVLGDGRFAYVFGCGACTPRPLRVFTMRDGTIADVTRAPDHAAIVRADMRRLRKICISKARYRNGACAAYVAEAATIGAFDAAWAEMLNHYEADGQLWAPEDADAKRVGAPHRSFPESLRAFLRHTGYIG